MDIGFGELTAFSARIRFVVALGGLTGAPNIKMCETAGCSDGH